MGERAADGAPNAVPRLPGSKLASYSDTGVQSVVQAQVLNILLRGRKMGKKGANGGRTEIQPTFRRRNGLSGREHLADSSK